MKTKSIVVAKPVVEDTSTVRILKRAPCASVSGKSSLAYEVGLDEKTKDVQLRVVSNSGRGCFSQQWVKVDAIRAHLDKAPKGETVTSYRAWRRCSGASLKTRRGSCGPCSSTRGSSRHRRRRSGRTTGPTRSRFWKRSGRSSMGRSQSMARRRKRRPPRPQRSKAQAPQRRRKGS